MPSVNFYDTSGGMLAIDKHPYPMGGITEPLPHLVACPLDWPVCTYFLKASSVTTKGGHPLLMKGFDLNLFPHVPLVPPESPNMPGVAKDAIAIFIGSSSKANLAASRVTGEGTALAVCVSSFVGLNSNCTTPSWEPSGTVWMPSTVVTRPSLGDYVAWIAGIILKYVLDQAASPGWKSGPVVEVAIRRLALKWFNQLLKLLYQEAAKEAPPWLAPYLPSTPLPTDLPSELGKQLGKLIDHLADRVD